MNDLLTEFHGPNAGYVLELYERYRQDPASVSDHIRADFDKYAAEFEAALSSPPAPGMHLSQFQPEHLQPAQPLPPGASSEQAAAVANLAQAIRTYGHLAAQLDPLGTPPRGDPWLDLAFHGLKDVDLHALPAELVAGPIGRSRSTAMQAVQDLWQVYSTHTGYEYGHIRIPQERDWLRDAAEEGWFRPPTYPIDQVALLDRLTQVDAFEQFLNRIYPGKTRFSIEGLDLLVPMLDDLLGCAAEEDICTVIIGMAHRGRLNVLAHILGKPYAHLLAEFRDPVNDFSTRVELGWTGDVKYHKGAHRAIQGGEQIQLIVGMPPNPSHLEHVDPVMLGMARAAGSKVDLAGFPKFFTKAALPVMIHGDASFSGQGIVAETLNLSQLFGYSVGGTLHIIANNQLGFTTPPEASRSTLYASDLAKGFQIPIIHVNADDPLACIEAMRTAFAYREQFNKDFLIDLVGYRRYGHNEGDEPGYTQPVMYQKINQHPSVRVLWGSELVERGLVESGRPEQLFEERIQTLQQEFSGLEPEIEQIGEELLPDLEAPPSGAARQVRTAVPIERLQELNEGLLKLPEDFTLNRKLTRSRQRRQGLFQDLDAPVIDWAAAEELAFATILADGVSIRLSGEDTGRGTFSSRHAVLHDAETGKTFIPLHALPQVQASFEILDSPLSENAALGFEFGYNIQAPARMVIWEAQYGDFINSAQAIIDEFIVSGRAKWGQTPSLVLLLPHAYEGQGPDHSSARPERFLQLAEQKNLRLANCTTAAQYFHLLRRQAALLKTDPLPLIVLTPKSLLRHASVASAPRTFSEGRWQPVIDDSRAAQDPDSIRRLILCSGKVYYDLVSDQRYTGRPEVAIARLEQIYPFPQADVEHLVRSYPNLQEMVWLQEEPENMGAWQFLRPRLEALLAGKTPLVYIGRSPNSSPAEGSAAWHNLNQKKIVSQAFEVERVHE